MEQTQKNVREVPVWKSQDVIEMTGADFEVIYNFIMNAQGAFLAAQGIMNRNLVNGTIQLDFEKFEDGKYVPMTDEEKAPYKEQFEIAVTAAKQKMKEASESKLVAV